MNETLAEAGKLILKNLVYQLSDKAQLLFKRIYSPDNLEMEIGSVVDNIPNEKVDRAITQCENTLKLKETKK